jgi:hypothetical protein
VILTGAALMLSGWGLGEAPNDFLLKLIGLTSCLYAPLDIKSDLLDRQIPSSDAMRLGELTGIPGWLWGGLWFVISIAGALYFMYLAAQPPPPRPPGEKSPSPPSTPKA